MAKPLLQVALDHSDLKGAIKAAVSVGKEVEIQNVQMQGEQLLKIMLYVEQTG